MEWMVCARTFLTTTFSQVWKPDVGFRILMGLIAGNMEKPVLCLKVKQTTAKCCKKTSCWSSPDTRAQSPTQKYQEDSCGPNGWQPTETKGVLTSKWTTWESTLHFPPNWKKWKTKQSPKQKFSEYSHSVGLAINPFIPLQMTRSL